MKKGWFEGKAALALDQLLLLRHGEEIGVQHVDAGEVLLVVKTVVVVAYSDGAPQIGAAKLCTLEDEEAVRVLGRHCGSSWVGW